MLEDALSYDDLSEMQRAAARRNEATTWSVGLLRSKITHARELLAQLDQATLSGALHADDNVWVFLGRLEATLRILITELAE